MQPRPLYRLVAMLTIIAAAVLPTRSFAQG
jgi:hypothetical protein